MHLLHLLLILLVLLPLLLVLTLCLHFHREKRIASYEERIGLGTFFINSFKKGKQGRTTTARGDAVQENLPSGMHALDPGSRRWESPVVRRPQAKEEQDGEEEGGPLAVAAAAQLATEDPSEEAPSAGGAAARARAPSAVHGCETAGPRFQPHLHLPGAANAGPRATLPSAHY